jgi:glutamyl-tRNA reductase
MKTAFLGARRTLRYDLIDDLFVAGVSFRDLTEENLQVLEDIALVSSRDRCRELLNECKTPLYELSILTKCNAVMVIAICLHPTTLRSMQASILQAWSHLTNGNAFRNRHFIKYFAGLDALRYLHEVAVGLHSVTLGDAQVFNQTRQALADSCYRVGDSSLLSTVVSSLRYTRRRVDTETTFFRGNISLERIACGIVQSACAAGSRIAIVGTGMSARLLAEILVNELSMATIIAGRNEKALGALRAKYESLTTCSLDEWRIVDTSDAVMVALEVNAETSQYVRNLYSTLGDKVAKKPLVVDISSPGFACRPSQGVTFVGIEELSAKAAAANEIRVVEARKVNEIIGEQLPVAAEILRMENLNRYLGSLDMDEVRGQQESFSRVSWAWDLGICLIGLAVATVGVGEVPKWIPFLSAHEIVIPIWIWILIGAAGLLLCGLAAILRTRLWATRLLEGYHDAHVRRLIPLPVDGSCLDRIHELGAGTTGEDTFVLRSTLAWLSKQTPESVRAWTMDGQNGDVRCFYVVAPLNSVGIKRMLSRDLKKNRDLRKDDVCRTFRRASGMYIIEVWGADDRAKAAILAALKIDTTEHLLRSKIGYIFSRPVNRFGQRQIEKAHFQRLGKGDREMWVKRLIQTVPL